MPTLKLLTLNLGGGNVFNAGLSSWSSYGVAVDIFNANSEQSQIGTPVNVVSQYNISTIGLATSNLDTRNDLLLELGGFLSVATDTLTLFAYTVEVLPG